MESWRIETSYWHIRQNFHLNTTYYFCFHSVNLFKMKQHSADLDMLESNPTKSISVNLLCLPQRPCKIYKTASLLQTVTDMAPTATMLHSAFTSTAALLCLLNPWPGNKYTEFKHTYLYVHPLCYVFDGQMTTHGVFVYLSIVFPVKMIWEHRGSGL